MKTITLDDCEKLLEDFKKYTETAEQYEFPLLVKINIMLDNSNFKNIVEDQKEARAMFRVVKRAIGQDIGEYLEEEVGYA